MEKIDLSTNSRKIQESYDKLIRGDPSVTYVVYSVDKDSTLDVTEVGNGSLDEFVENFSDGQVQFGIARVTVPGSDVSKNILLGWCPDNSPSKARLSFASNFAEVSKILSGYHVQITARDQDDLDVDEFLNRVGAAAGARYSIQGAGAASSGNKKPVSATPAPKPVVAKPIVSKPAISKPVGPKPSFIPKSTGKPIKPVKSPGFIQSTKPPRHDDGWGDAKDVEVRDFEEKPLDDVPSAYKPTKVDIEHLRKQKSDTVSSTPRSEFKPQEQSPEDEKPKPLSERMKAYNDPNDGRLTSLPKSKVGHVASRYTASAKAESGAPSFGAKPVFGAKPTAREDKLVGGLSRDFGSQGGKTPAQIWAEKRGQYKSVPAAEEPVKSTGDDEEEHAHASELVNRFEEKVQIKDEEEEVVKAPIRNLPPPPVRHVVPEPEPEPEAEEEEEEEEAPAPAFPPRSNVVSEPVEPEQEEEEEEEPAPPSLPSRGAAAPEPKKESVIATAEYDYVKDEDNEIGFAEGDLIVDIEFTDEEWWTGKHSKTGEVGLFPAAYVSLNEQKEPQPEVKQEEPAPAAPTLPSREEPKAKAKPTATAEYDYEKDEDNEIGFAEGEIIVDIDFVDEDWWSGTRQKTGEVGLFPANYVKLN